MELVFFNKKRTGANTCYGSFSSLVLMETAAVLPIIKEHAEPLHLDIEKTSGLCSIVDKCRG
jgi:hypothetical protein